VEVRGITPAKHVYTGANGYGSHPKSDGSRISRNEWFRPLSFKDVEDMNVTVDASIRSFCNGFIVTFSAMKY
jgi:hypothetical protein